MLEAVGYVSCRRAWPDGRADVHSKEFIPGYFSMLDWVLNAKGAACFQVITMPESRFERCGSVSLLKELGR